MAHPNPNVCTGQGEQRSTGVWVRVFDPDALDAALELAFGPYQRNIVLGFHNLSGSTIERGTGVVYTRERATLLARLTHHGVVWSERRDILRGRRILVLGEVRL